MKRRTLKMYHLNLIFNYDKTQRPVENSKYLANETRYPSQRTKQMQKGIIKKIESSRSTRISSLFE